MDRRTLLTGLSAAAAWLSISGCTRFVLDGRTPESGDIAAPITPLSEQLAELADPLFREYSAGRSVDALRSELARKGVISTLHGINHQKVISLARHEPLVLYKGFYYTQTELELYALAYLGTDQNRGRVLVPRSSSALALLVFLGFSGFLEAGDCEMDETEQALLNRVNEARSQPRQCGDQPFDAVEPLSWNCKLEDAARAHSEDMAELEYFSHTGPEGVQTGERVNDRGYRWSAVGENIAAGQDSVDQVVDGWLSSPGHCANIMSVEFTEMGAARIDVPGSQYSPFWTQVFARPR